MPTTIDELKVLLCLHGIKCVRIDDRSGVYLVRPGQYYNVANRSWTKDVSEDQNKEVIMDFYPVVRSWLADGMPI